MIATTAYSSVTEAVISREREELKKAVGGEQSSSAADSAGYLALQSTASPAIPTQQLQVSSDCLPPRGLKSFGALKSLPSLLSILFQFSILTV
jgi:hypothetical protein